MSTKIYKLAHISNILNMVVSQPLKQYELPISPYRMVNQQYEISRLQQRLDEEMQNHKKQMKQIQHKLLKEQELSFILKSYFQKIEKVVYNGTTNIFNHEPLNYQKIEIYLRQLIRRMQDINNHKLTAPPRIYKNSNIKTYRLEPKQPN